MVLLFVALCCWHAKDWADSCSVVQRSGAPVYAVSSPIVGAAEVSKSIPVFVSSESKSGFFRILNIAAATKRSPPPSERAVMAPVPSPLPLDSSDGVVPPPSLSPLIGSSLSSSAGASVSKMQSFKIRENSGGELKRQKKSKNEARRRSFTSSSIRYEKVIDGGPSSRFAIRMLVPWQWTHHTSRSRIIWKCTNADFRAIARSKFMHTQQCCLS